MYAVNYSELLEQAINVSDPSWPTMPCRYGWEYNYTEVPYASIASEVSTFLNVWTFRMEYLLAISLLLLLVLNVHECVGIYMLCKP